MSDEKFVIPKSNSLFVSDDLLNHKQDIENQLQDQSIDDNELGMMSCTINCADTNLVGFLKSIKHSQNSLTVEVSVVATLAIKLLKQIKYDVTKVEISVGETEDFYFMNHVKKAKITNIANQVCTLKLMFEVNN